MAERAAKAGVLLVNFGEPEAASMDEVVPFLERIFYANAALEPDATEERRLQRSRELALRRAPGLLEEYRSIGSSPLNRQAEAQARALSDALVERGIEARVYSGFQFTAPLVDRVVETALADGMERLVVLPVYPLAGYSTNVAALDQVERAVEAAGESGVSIVGVSGWHRHPGYLELRAATIRGFLQGHSLAPGDSGVKLLFSAHGTPMKYVHAGSGYVAYVEEFCREVAALLGVEDYALGYQNHSNRGVEWTQPDVEAVVRDLDADTVVLDPVSFMHEQSETLAELDIELKEEAEERGLRFLRVPVPHDDARFAEVLADLVEPFLQDGEGSAGLGFGACRCRPAPGTYCLNARPRSEAARMPRVPG